MSESIPPGENERKYGERVGDTEYPCECPKCDKMSYMDKKSE